MINKNKTTTAENHGTLRLRSLKTYLITNVVAEESGVLFQK